MANVLDSGARTRSTTTTASTRPRTATTVTPGGYNPAYKAPAGTPTGSQYSGGNLTTAQAQSISNYLNTPTATQPSGYPTGGGGGGGGGSVTPGLDQGSFDAILDMFRGAQPNRYDHTSLNLPEYNAPKFYDFDSGQFDTARQGIRTGIADARQMGSTAFDRAAQGYQNYQDPFASGPRQYNPGVDPRLLASMQAWGGAGSGAAAETSGEGVQADAAMGSVYDLLGKVGRQFNQGQLAGIEGDRMQLDQRLGGEERMLNLGVEMALARAKSQYQQDLFAYGKAEADKRYEMKVAEVMANNQGVNAANQANIQAGNSYNQSILGPIMELLMAGRNSQGVQGLNPAAVPGMTRWEMN
jgi:hypothetical protein